MSKKLDPYIGLFLLLFLWYLTVNIWEPVFLPSPLETFSKLVELAKSGQLIKDVLATTYGALVGFLSGALIGIFLGIIVGYFTRVYSTFSFVIDFFRSIPPIALFPLAIIFLGIGLLPKIALIAFAVTWVLLINTAYGVLYSSATRKKAALLLGAKGRQLFADVLFPEALPQIYSGLRIAVSLSLILMVTFEMFFGSTSGLGFRIYESALTYKITELYSYIFVTGFLGFALNKAVVFFEKINLHWLGN